MLQKTNIFIILENRLKTLYCNNLKNSIIINFKKFTVANELLKFEALGVLCIVQYVYLQVLDIIAKRCKDRLSRTSYIMLYRIRSDWNVRSMTIS